MGTQLPGGVGVSKLSVYDTTAPGGLRGGRPHTHLTCSAGFLALRAGGPEALAEFHAAATRLVAPELPEWRKRWQDGALRTAEETGRQLDALARGDHSHLADGGIEVLPEAGEHGRHGTCGLLDTYPLS